MRLASGNGRAPWQWLSMLLVLIIVVMPHLCFLVRLQALKISGMLSVAMKLRTLWLSVVLLLSCGRLKAAGQMALDYSSVLVFRRLTVLCDSVKRMLSILWIMVQVLILWCCVLQLMSVDRITVMCRAGVGLVQVCVRLVSCYRLQFYNVVISLVVSVNFVSVLCGLCCAVLWRV